MKVKYINNSSVSLTNGEIYEVLSIDGGLFNIIDNTGDAYLFYPEEFEVVPDAEAKTQAES